MSAPTIRAPRGHVIDPACTSESSHGYLRSYTHEGCRCPGKGMDKFLAYRSQQAQAARDRYAASSNGAARWPSVKEAADLEKQLWSRDDLACASADPSAFNVIGTGAAANAQAAEARAICSGCPALSLCREVGIAVDYKDQVLGGMTYAERVEVRRERKKRGAA